jgi:DNA-binding response OmpR family regulator
MTARVVVVDDQSEVRKLVRMVLAVEDIELNEAADADAGLALIRELRPEVAIVDVMMPGALDGLDLCEIVNGDRSLAGTCVIMMSALGAPQDLAAGRDAGAHAYLVKPFSFMNLLEAVDQCRAVCHGSPPDA